ncbi:VOC family protein [Chitinophaga varians]|uniref:VOC family protein n=1 Tax=Chitinophaga varians TaxID=2202339 RepID=UPI00165FD7CB|nr:VOC family protein [Chitinophaga varians]MBC9913808.1 VOC family protein [Chitinophaga varians]
MITQVTHMTVYVLDQNRALDFYTNKLGFRVVTDVPMGKDVRWLTVSPPQQPGLEIVLSPVSTAMFKQETVDAMTDLVSKGTFGVAVLTCDDIYATYEEMTAKGVEFTKAPKKEFYGTEAIFKDDSGNWFSLAQLT